MKLNRFAAALAACCLVLLAISAVKAQESNYRVSEPYTYKNLTIFLLHGKDEASARNILTLQEALERGIFVVYETSDVNELTVENLSKEFDVFIQSGDIVKGGKQDRILGVSIIVPARSGRMNIQAYCVESGRWTKRGSEESSKFTSSNDRIVSKDLKLAANSARSQSEVWEKVSEVQGKLSKNLGQTVNSPRSSSSLQLSLENSKVTATTDEYVRKLSPIIAGKSDVIGYAFAINGKINSADVYVSNALFRKLWPKMLKASAIEAVSEFSSRPVSAPKSSAVSAFMSEADSAIAKETAVGRGARIISREDSNNAVFEARDEKKKVMIHKSYVKKQ